MMLMLRVSQPLRITCGRVEVGRRWEQGMPQGWGNIYESRIHIFNSLVTSNPEIKIPTTYLLRKFCGTC